MFNSPCFQFHHNFSQTETFPVSSSSFLFQEDRERTETWYPDSHHRPSGCLLPRLGAPHCVTPDKAVGLLMSSSSHFDTCASVLL